MVTKGRLEKYKTDAVKTVALIVSPSSQHRNDSIMAVQTSEHRDGDTIQTAGFCTKRDFRLPQRYGHSLPYEVAGHKLIVGYGRFGKTHQA